MNLYLLKRKVHLAKRNCKKVMKSSIHLFTHRLILTKKLTDIRVEYITK